VDLAITATRFEPRDQWAALEEYLATLGG